MHSYMSRLAVEIDEQTNSDKENETICKELTLFWNSGDESKLSPKAKEIWLAWKHENENSTKVNPNLGNEWEGA